MEKNIKNLYEYCDGLNSPIEAFLHTSIPDNFPILPHWHYFFEIINILNGNVEVTCNENVYNLTPGDIIIFCPKHIHSIYETPAEAISACTEASTPTTDTDILTSGNLFANSLSGNEYTSNINISIAKNGLSLSKKACLSPLSTDEIHPKIDQKHGSIQPVPEKTILSKNCNIRYQVLKFDLNFLHISGNYKSRFLNMMNVAYEQNPENIFFSKEDLKNYQIYELFEQCIEEIKTRQYGYDTLIGTNIAKLLTYLSRIWISKGIAVDEKILCASAPDNPFDNITEYIDRHYNEQLQVKELAKMCNMSYSNFARSFKQLYNQSCKEYIEFIRLNRVADLLIYTDLDLNYISQETGFSDCSHLIRSFKHWKGMTPKVWRREYGNS